MSIAEQMLPEFDDEMARTRKVLAAIPANKMDWQPHEKLHTIGWNANHLAEIPSWIGGTLQSSEFDIAPVDGPAYTGLTLTDPAAILEAFDRNVAEGRAQLAAASDETLGEDWTMKMGG